MLVSSSGGLCVLGFFCFVGASWHTSKEMRLRCIACFPVVVSLQSGAMWVTK